MAWLSVPPTCVLPLSSQSEHEFILQSLIQLEWVLNLLPMEVRHVSDTANVTSVLPAGKLTGIPQSFTGKFSMQHLGSNKTRQLAGDQRSMCVSLPQQRRDAS